MTLDFAYLLLIMPNYYWVSQIPLALYLAS